MNTNEKNTQDSEAKVKKVRGPDKKPRKRGPEHGNYIHGQGQNRERDMPRYKLWMEAVYQKDNFRCFITNKTIEEAGAFRCHHLEGWNTDIGREKRYDVNNGVLLAKDVHEQFHSLYGYGGNRRDEFETFARTQYGITSFPWQEGNHEPNITPDNVQDPVKTIQRRRLDDLKLIALERGHFVAEGEDGTNSSTVKMYCLPHNCYQQVKVGNYKKTKLGLKCCQRAAQSLGAQHSNQVQALMKKLLQPEEDDVIEC